MKKKLGAILLALVLAVGLAIPASVAAHTEEDPFVTDLLAGQNMDVGDVEVWNDDTTLYVTYEITDLDWAITETHLYVGKTDPNTLTTAPGQFPYDDDDADSVTDTMVTYVIPLDDIDGYHMQLNKKGKPTGVMVADGTTGVIPCETDVYIAAHAVVQKCVVEQFEFVPELTWQRSSEETVAVYPGYGAQWTEADGLAIVTPLTLVWDGGDVGQYFTGYSTRSDISWASWVCTQPGTPSTTGTDLRRFQATFDIPAGYSVTGGTLGSVNPGYEDVIPMNDNIYIFANMDVDGSPGDELIFWGGTISIPQLDPTRTHFLGIERRDTEPQNKAAFPETDGWHMDGAIPAISSSLFVEGPNVLDVFAEELWTGGGMHELGLTLQVEQTTCETETAWGDGTDFDHPNWATYFTYHVQFGPTCMELRENPPFKDVPDAGEYVAGSVCLYGDSANDELDVEVNVDDGDASARYGVYLERYDGTTGGSGHWLSWERLGYLTTDAGGVGSFSTSKSRSPSTYYYQIVLSKRGAWGPEAFGTDIAEIVIN